VALPDLSKVDRTLVEPSYNGQPSYCLLVFGPQADSRVWLVLDDDTLYVDREGTGDLSKPGRSVTPHRENRHELDTGLYREWEYDLGDLSPAGGKDRHTAGKLLFYQEGDKPPGQVLSLRYQGMLPQYAGWKPLFGKSREVAPILHFGGPLVVRPLRGGQIARGQAEQEIHFCLTTPGHGPHSDTYVAYEAAPAGQRPVVEVTWPPTERNRVERFRLRERC
jgi:hypothetical protein